MVKIDKLNFLIVISFLLLTFDYFGILKAFTNLSAKITLPVKREIYTSYHEIRFFGQILGNFSQIQKQVLENKKLYKTNQELDLKVAQLTLENTKLRQQLEAPLPPSFKFLPATVVSVARYMEVWAGKKDKVKEGMAVLDGTTLIGKVISVSDDRSQVLLVSDREMTIPAKTSRGAVGVVVGQTGGLVTLEKVLQKDPLFIDDLVVTSGDRGIPPDLLIGKIAHINSDDVSPYKQAKLVPALDYSSLKIVFILTAV